MARQTGTGMGTRGRAGASPGGMGPEELERMIRETAYFHYVERGYAPGHEMEDWIAAKAEVERRISEEEQEAGLLDFGVQQGGPIGPREDEALKRMIKQHPVRDIPQVESVEPSEAPLKE